MKHKLYGTMIDRCESWLEDRKFFTMMDMCKSMGIPDHTALLLVADQVTKGHIRVYDSTSGVYEFEVIDKEDR